jgi:ATP-binding cassette subfamily F protein 3
LALLKLLLSGANFLLLDEPTNHLDIESRQVVEDMLADFSGTVLVVSHDRYFIDQVAERVIAIEDGRLKYYWGNYSYYHEKMQEKLRWEEAQKREYKEKAAQPENLLREKEKELKRIQRQMIKELEEIEAHIVILEERKAELEGLLAEPATYNNEDQARACTAEYKQLEQSLQAAYAKWETCAQQVNFGDSPQD